MYLIAVKGGQLQIDGSKPRAWQTEGAGCVVMDGLLLWCENGKGLLEESNLKHETR